MSKGSEPPQRGMDDILNLLGDKKPTPPEEGVQQSGPRRRQKPESPWGAIIAGFVLSVVGGVALMSGTAGIVVVGIVCAALGGVSMLIGTIAVGVRLGMAWFAYEQDRS